MIELSPEIDAKSTIFIGDLSNTHHIDTAASRIAAGSTVAVDNDSVWALWGDAGHRQFVEAVQNLKGRNKDNRFGLTLPFNIVSEYADLNRIHPSLRILFEEPDRLTNLLGAIAFIRYPITESAAEQSPLNDKVVSADKNGLPLLQNYDPSGKISTEILVISALSHGARLPAASSMNISGQTEITTIDEAANFINEHRIGNVLEDPKATHLGTGSYVILEVDADGFCLQREGNVSNDITARILAGYPLRINPCCKQAKGRPLSGLEGLYGHELRQALIEVRQWDRLPAISE